MATKKQKEVVEKYVHYLTELKDRYSYDKEGLHSEADRIMVLAMEELGFTEIADAYKECEKEGFWYG